MDEMIHFHIEMDKDTYRAGDKIIVHLRDEHGRPIEEAEAAISTGTVTPTDATGKTTTTIINRE